MKTNHRRNFVAEPHRDQAMFGASVIAPLSDKSFGASIGNDFTKGHRGASKSKRGAKKYLRSRVRHHENAATKKLTEK